MPTSYTQNIPPIMAWIERRRPRRILDVGTGYGKYGWLIRERVDDFRFNTEIYGIEVFRDYTDRSRPSWYDEIYHGNFLDDNPEIRGMLAVADPLDLVLMIDVLEHFTQEDGFKALDKALHLGKDVLISTPLGYPQGPVNGNEHESHLSEWPLNVLMDFIDNYEDGNLEVLRAGTRDTVLVVMGLA